VKAAALPQAELAHLGLGSASANILSATLGNIVGGAVLVGLVYWFVYLASARTDRHPAG
jgi:formate/nitrite transporter FocA (FNT family)